MAERPLHSEPPRDLPWLLRLQPPAPVGGAEAAGGTSPPTGASPRGPKALPADTLGLALSGGGIRSAAFCLGVLQALARAGLKPGQWMNMAISPAVLWEGWSPTRSGRRRRFISHQSETATTLSPDAKLRIVKTSAAASCREHERQYRLTS